MKICLDARQIRSYPTGLGSYSRYLVQHLAAVDDDNDYVVLRHDSDSPVVQQRNFTELALPYSIFTVRNLLTGASALRRIEADVYHSLFHFLPLGAGLPRTVVTLHDLIAVEHSELSMASRSKRWSKSRCVRPWLRHALGRTDHIVAVSDSTRSAALTRYHLEPGRISTVHSGVDNHLWNGTSHAAVPEIARANGRRFIFSLGNTHPYKNLPRLVQAFARIAPRFPDVDLIITSRGSTYATLQRVAGQAGISARVKLSGNISDEEVKGCFKKALFFAFPSLVEGFGLPVLESMACGCPVLTSDCSALKEIAADAALLVDPTDIDAIAAGMSKLIQEGDLRDDLIERGKARASVMTWEQTARQMVAIYRQLAGEQ